MIDAHHHLWTYGAAAYPWIRDDMAVLRRDFLVDDLRAAASGSGITGFVTVQARQTVEETEWLLDIADRHHEILGVVGWAPLAEPHVGGILERLAARPRLRGVRHILQDEPDDEHILRADFNRGVMALRAAGLTYDILIYERHLPQTMRFVDRHPNQLFVLDHVAKPHIRAREIAPWREQIVELARREHVFCKVSGMVTEADWRTWTAADLQPYVDIVLEAFGPERLMFGSDWPVLVLAASYDEWVWTFRETIRALSPDEQAWITMRTARRAYGLGR